MRTIQVETINFKLENDLLNQLYSFWEPSKLLSEFLTFEILTKNLITLGTGHKDVTMTLPSLAFICTQAKLSKGCRSLGYFF